MKKKTKSQKKAKFLRNVACTASKNKTFASKTRNVMKEQRKKKELEERTARKLLIKKMLNVWWLSQELLAAPVEENFSFSLRSRGEGAVGSPQPNSVP